MLTKEEILKQAAEVVLENGYNCTRLEDVAARIGVTRPNLYYHFKNKEDLIYSLLDWVEDDYRKNVVEPSLHQPDPISGILNLVDNCFSIMRAHQWKGGCIMGNLAQELANVNEPIRQRISVFFEDLVQQVEKVLSQEQCRDFFVEHFDRARVSRGIIAMIQGSMLLGRASRCEDYLADCRELIRDYLTSQKRGN